MQKTSSKIRRTITIMLLIISFPFFTNISFAATTPTRSTTIDRSLQITNTQTTTPQTQQPQEQTITREIPVLIEPPATTIQPETTTEPTTSRLSQPSDQTTQIDQTTQPTQEILQPPIESVINTESANQSSKTLTNETITAPDSTDTTQPTLTSPDDPPEYRDPRRSFKTVITQSDQTSGALVTSYPLTIPPGRNGMQPSLSLEYNSQNNENINNFGYGWTINIPYIERTNKLGTDHLYIDNYFSSYMEGELNPITLSDGTHGSYGAKIENGNFSKHTFNTGNYWEVTDKNGTKYTFGSLNGIGNLSDPSNATRTYRWYLTEVRDTNDNFIKYEYSSNYQGQIYPTKIKYTGSGAADGIFEIEFFTESRNDKATSFSTGFGITNNYRINRIDIKINGSWVRRYDLVYTTSDNNFRSLLLSITESGKDESGVVTSLNAEKFEYRHNQPNPGWNYDPKYFMPVDIFNEEDNTPDNGVRFADINGDGFVDILHARHKKNMNGPSISNIYINNKNGTGWTLDPNYKMPPIYFADWYGEDGGARIAEVNGDGLPDIIYTGDLDDDTGKPSFQEVYINKGAGAEWELNLNYECPVAFNYENKYGKVVDNGVRLADVNGDGLTDFLWSRKGWNAIYINNGYGWDVVFYDIPVKFDEPGTKIADVNGDGLVDFVYYKIEDDTLTTYINNGVYSLYQYGSIWIKNTYKAPKLSPVQKNYEIWDDQIRIEDINGDGLADLIYDGFGEAIYNNKYNNTAVFLNLGNDQGWAQTASYKIQLDFAISFFALSSMGSEFADVNGDKITDFISTSFGQRKVYISNFQEPDLLSTIYNPIGGETEITYAPTTSYKDNSGNLLNPKMPFVMQTVLTIKEYSGYGEATGNKYEYSGGKYFYSSPTNRRFAGFNKITKRNNPSNPTQIISTYYHQGDSINDTGKGEFLDDEFKIGKIYYTETADNNGVTYQQTFYKWESKPIGNNRSFVKMTNQVDTTFGKTDFAENSDSKMTSFSYDDSNGNVIQKTNWGYVTYLGNWNISDQDDNKLTTTIEYAKNAQQTILGFPSKETVVDKNSNKIAETQYFYDNLGAGNISKGNLTSQLQWNGGSTYIATTKTHNNYGLVTENKDANNNTTKYIYDQYNLYPSSITDPKNQKVSYEYDYSAGEVKQTVTPNGLIFQTEYDGLDRIKTEKQPSQTNQSVLVNKTTYSYYDQSKPFYIIQKNNTDSNNGQTKYTYYDNQYRVMEEKTLVDSAVPNYVTKTYAYNNIGMLASESLPFYTTVPGSGAATVNSLYINYTYDPLLRVKTITNNVGITKNGYLASYQEITDPLNNTKKLYYDAYGNLRKVDGNSGYAEYTYNSLNKLIKISDTQGNIRNFTYDTLGRLLKAEDLHAANDTTFGTVSYSYDNNGNALTKTDQKGQVTTYVYDSLNRLIKEISPDNKIIEYTYDSVCTYGFGKLCQVSTPDVTTKYKYTTIGTVATETKTIDGKDYITSFIYDFQGNVMSMTYPDNTQVLYGFNSAGKLKTVKNGNSNVINNIEYAPTGAVSKMEYANGTITENTYDQYKLYRLIAKTTKKGATTIQNVSYAYDKVGNITNIINYLPQTISKTAVYTYDNMYRLTSATITGTGNNSNYTQTYTYDKIGNITNRSDKGQYSYNGNQGTSYATPDAVTSIGAANYTYDKNGNLTSDDQRNLTWDYKNRLTQVVSPTGTTSYSYDAGSDRIKQTNPNTTTIYPNKYYEVENGNITKHIFAGNENVASIAQYEVIPPPAAITNLVTLAPTFSSITLTWTAPGSNGNTGTAASYDVRYATWPITENTWTLATQATGEPVPQIAGTTQSMTINNLNQGTAYYFAIKTSNADSAVSGISNTVFGKTLAPDTAPPNKISNLIASNPGMTSIVLTWMAPGDDWQQGTAASYDIRYSTSTITENNFSSALPVQGTKPVPKLAGTTQSMTVEGLSPSTTYYFAVKTSDEVPNTSGISNIAINSTLKDMTPPAAITDLKTSNPGLTTMILTWTAPGNNGNTGKASHYDIRYSTSPITESNWNSAEQAGEEFLPQIAGTAQSMTVAYLSNDTMYYFAIKTKNTEGAMSGLSNVASGKTLPKPDTVPPNIVTKITISDISSTTMTLTWTAPGDDINVGTASSYDIRYSTSVITGLNWESATQVTGEPTPQVAGTIQSMKIVELNPSTTYYFAMKTSDEVPNVSSLSNLASGTTLPKPDTTPPAAITNIATLDPKETAMTLTWTAPGDDEKAGTATIYDIRYSTSTITESNWGTATQVIGEPVPQIAGTIQSMPITGLKSSTKYYFAIKTSDEVPNISPLSTVAIGTTLAPPDTTPPSAISTLKITIKTSKSITLAWRAPGDDGSTGTAKSYDIRYSTSEITAANFAAALKVPQGIIPIPQTAGTSQSVTIAGLTPSTTYYFAIKTSDEIPNTSQISNIISGTTLVGRY